MGNNSKSNNLEVKYGLPEEIVYCKRCVYSNQRPSSTVEYKKSNPAETIETNIKLKIGSELTFALWSMLFIEMI